MFAAGLTSLAISPMSGLLSLLLASPWALGGQTGGGWIDGGPHLVLSPWIGLQVEDFAASLQAPLRVDLDRGQLREADWDSLDDLGRVVRLVRAGETLKVGALPNSSLGHGTLVRRYHNRVDDDTWRLGAQLRFEGEQGGGAGFVDHLVGPPVVAARLHARLSSLIEVGATGAVDTFTPEQEARAGYGADLSLHLIEEALSLYGDFNLLNTSPGAHVGVEGRRGSGAWRVDGRLEGGWSSAGYRPGIFDTGYLVDRHALPSVRAAFGGRVALGVGYEKALSIGLEYADAEVAGRASIAGWLQVPLEQWTLALLWRSRYGADRAALFDPAQALAAASARVLLDPGWWISLTGGRVWRVRPDDTPAAGAELTLAVEAAFGL